MKIRKNILKVFSGVLFMVLIFQHAQAQQPRKLIQPLPDNIARDISERLAATVELRTGQKDSVFMALKSFFVDMENNRGVASAEFTDALKKVRDGKIEKILTDEQKYLTYLSLIEEFDNHNPQQKPGDKPPFGPGEENNKKGPGPGKNFIPMKKYD